MNYMNVHRTLKNLRNIIVKTKNEIVVEIYSNERINKNIEKNVPIRFRDDFKSHFYIQLLEMPEEKLFKAYNEGYLINLCLRILMNHINKRSMFWKIYRNSGGWTEIFVDNTNNQINQIPNEETYQEDYEDIEQILYDVELILKDMDPIDVYIFKKYYYEGFSYRDIEKLTNVSFSVIRNRIIPVLNIVKEKINNKWKP